MQKFPALKQILLASSIALSISGCGDAGQQRELSKEEVQFLSHLDQARFYQRQGQLKASIEEAQNALKLDPRSRDPYLIVADNLLIAGDARNAEKHFRNLLEPQENVEPVEGGNLYNRALLGLASSLAMQKKLPDARATLEKLNSPSKEDQAEALLLQGDMALSENNQAEAKQFYEQAREVTPNNIKAIVALSRLAAIQNDPETVDKLIAEGESINNNDSELWLWKAQYAESKQQYAEAEDAYVKALEDIGRYDLMTYRKYQAISRLVSVLRAQGKVSEAFAYEEILAKSGPGAVKSGYETALKLYKEGKLDEAALELEKILAQAPGHTDSGILLGMIKYAKGDLQAAEQILSRYSAEGTTPAVSKMLAATKIKLQQPEEAAQILKQLGDQEKDPEILSLLGIASLASGDTAEGVSMIEQALAINPNNTELRTRLARFHLQDNKPENAIAQLEKVLAQDKDDDSAKTLLTSAYMRAGKTAQAESYAKDWLKKSPKNPAALNALGSIAIQKNDLTTARSYFKQASDANPKNVTPLLNLANLEVREKNWETAQSIYASVLKVDAENAPAIGGLINMARQNQKMDSAVTLLKQVASDNPKAVNARFALAEMAAIEGDLAQAEMLMQDVETAGGGSDRLERFRPNLYRIAVEQRLSAKDYDGARSIIKKAMERTPDNLELQLLSAKVEFIAEKPEQGLAVITKVKQQHETSPAPHEFEGDYYASKGEFKKAVESYRTAWNLQNTQGLAIKMHQALRQSNEMEASLQPLKEWLSIQPNSPQAMTLLAMGYQADGQFDKAISQYEKIRQIRPNDAVALNNLAWLYQETGNKAAESTAKSAYDVSPNNAAIADTYGWILVQNNKMKQGIEVLQKAHDLDPASRDISLHLAEAYDKAGQPEKAKQLRNKLAQN